MSSEPNPYESPSALVSERNRQKAFRSSFFFTTLILVVYCSVPYLITEYLEWNLRGNLVSMLTELGVLALIATAMSAIVVAATPVYVNKESICGYTMWGPYKEIEWSSIHNVRPINLLGLRYLRVFTANETFAIWIPLFLAAQDRFNACVIEYTDSENPIRRYITAS